MWYPIAMTLTLELPAETETRLRRSAAREGRTLADYVRSLAETEARRQREFEDDIFARYEGRELTHGEAASLLGVPRADFLAELGRRGLSVFQYDAAQVLSEAGLE